MAVPVYPGYGLPQMKRYFEYPLMFLALALDPALAQAGTSKSKSRSKSKNTHMRV